MAEPDNLEVVFRLLEFFREEFRREEEAGFPLLSKIPDTMLAAQLAYYKGLRPVDRADYVDYMAHRACGGFDWLVGVPPIDHTKHSFFPRCSEWLLSANRYWNIGRSVPHLRALISQFKLDTKRDGVSRIPQEQFDQASAMKPIKAPELRKRVRAALTPLGYRRIDEQGFFLCQQGEIEFRVGIDCGGHRQLGYAVIRPDCSNGHYPCRFVYEGFFAGTSGDWDSIFEDDVDAAFETFTEAVKRSYELPDKIRAAVR